MINISTDQRKWIVKLTDIPSNAVQVKYIVSYEDDADEYNCAFVGKGFIIGDTYEFDLQDFVDYRLSHPEVADTDYPVISYKAWWVDADGNESFAQGHDNWVIQKKSINLPIVDDPSNDQAPCPAAVIRLNNSDLRPVLGSDPIIVPLVVEAGILKGEVRHKLDKITHIDRYGDTYTDSVRNKIEIDCFVDPDWLNVKTGNDESYANAIAALQTARSTQMVVACGVSGLYKAMYWSDYKILEGRVADVEEIKTYSKYNSNHYTRGLKVTFEVYY